MSEFSVGAVSSPEVLEGAHTLRIEEGRIAAISPSEPPASALAELRAAPGFIDLQFNGGFGHDFTEAPESLWEVAAQLPRFGVTSFLPTIITSPEDARRRAQETLNAGPPPGWSGARPLGLHFEGPFLEASRKGAHDAASLRAIDPALCASWRPEDGVRWVTLAPELPGALELVEELHSRGVVVSAGHSAASYEEAHRGFDAGIRAVTHLFNAMPPLHHRKPGLAAAAMERDDVLLGVIPDLIHVHPAMLALVERSVGLERISVVTDAMAAMGMPEGRYRLGPFEVVVDASSARLSDGTLAGSIVTLDSALRRMQRATGRSWSEVLACATRNAGRALGEERGRLVAGEIADIVLLDAEDRVQACYCEGRRVYCAPRYEELLP